MLLSPDDWILFSIGEWQFNATLVFSWAVMTMLILVSAWIGRRLRTTMEPERGQNVLEVIVLAVRRQTEEVAPGHGRLIVPFVGTLFVYIAACNLLTLVPGYAAPTASISTTVALALCVLVAVPVFGIRTQGLRGYLRHYVEPTVFMLPFNVLGEVSRTVALAIRLFGNVMSGGLILAVLLALVPFVIPIFMRAFGLLTGLVQAYVFAMLALIYIASATRVSLSPDRSTEAPDATAPPAS